MPLWGRGRETRSDREGGSPNLDADARHDNSPAICRAVEWMVEAAGVEPGTQRDHNLSSLAGTARSTSNQTRTDDPTVTSCDSLLRGP